MSRMYFRLIIISFCIILIFNLSCNPPTESPTTGTIKGKVLDAATSNPISAVMITTDPVTSSKTTDSEGIFLIEGIEPGIYIIQASKNGYKTNSTTVNVVVGEEASSDIQLFPLTPELSVSVTSLSFGTSSSSLTFNITNSGIGILTWSIISTASWITVNPTSGSTENESDVVTVTVDRSGKSFGNYLKPLQLLQTQTVKQLI